MTRKPIGKGWWYESERHRLARMGIKTGSKLKEKPSLGFPLAHVPMAIGITPGSKELLKRRADEQQVIKKLKRHGWSVREEPFAIPPGGYEAKKGKNYLLINRTHWKKLKIVKAYIYDKEEIPRLRKLFRKPYPYTLPPYQFSKSSTEEQINKILYKPNKEQKDKEVLTIEIPKEKSKHLKFLEAYTRFPTQGVWKKIKDNNIQYEIEFNDSKNEKYGKKLMKLFNKLNKEKINEDLLYVRTEPVEESTL